MERGETEQGGIEQWQEPTSYVGHYDTDGVLAAALASGTPISTDKDVLFMLDPDDRMVRGARVVLEEELARELGAVKPPRQDVLPKGLPGATELTASLRRAYKDNRTPPLATLVVAAKTMEGLPPQRSLAFKALALGGRVAKAAVDPGFLPSPKETAEWELQKAVNGITKRFYPGFEFNNGTGSSVLLWAIAAQKVGRNREGNEALILAVAHGFKNAWVAAAQHAQKQPEEVRTLALALRAGRQEAALGTPDEMQENLSPGEIIALIRAYPGKLQEQQEAAKKARQDEAAKRAEAAQLERRKVNFEVHSSRNYNRRALQPSRTLWDNVLTELDAENGDKVTILTDLMGLFEQLGGHHPHVLHLWRRALPTLVPYCYANLRLLENGFFGPEEAMFINTLPHSFEARPDFTSMILKLKDALTTAAYRYFAQPERITSLHNVGTHAAIRAAYIYALQDLGMPGKAATKKQTDRANLLIAQRDKVLVEHSQGVDKRLLPATILSIIDLAEQRVAYREQLAAEQARAARKQELKNTIKGLFIENPK